MAQLIGYFRLGKDAELRYMTDGTAVTNLSLAYNYGQKDQQTGKRPTQWVEGALWGQRAVSLYDYLLQGQGFCATIDDVHTETYTKGDGSLGVKMVGKISNLEFAGSAPQQGQQQQQQAPQRQAPQQQQATQRQAPAQAQAPRQRPAPQQPARQHQGAPAGGSGFDDMDDDIPF